MKNKAKIVILAIAFLGAMFLFSEASATVINSDSDFRDSYVEHPLGELYETFLVLLVVLGGYLYLAAMPLSAIAFLKLFSSQEKRVRWSKIILVILVGALGHITNARSPLFYLLGNVLGHLFFFALIGEVVAFFLIPFRTENLEVRKAKNLILWSTLFIIVSIFATLFLPALIIGRSF